jgi:hypothetical protein
MADSKKKTADQAADDYPDLSAPETTEAPAEEPTIAEAAAEAAGPRFNAKKQFSMCWHNGLKAYVQDGVIFDRGSKEPVGKL